MPVVQFRSLDVFAFLDADSPEARAFTTYAGYLEAIAELLTDAYGVFVMRLYPEELQAPSTRTSLITEREIR